MGFAALQTPCLILGRSRPPGVKILIFRDLHGPKPYKFTGFGDLHGPKPYKFIGFGDLHGPKPYKFIGFGDLHGPEKHINKKEYFPEAGLDVLPAVPGRRAPVHD